MSMFGEVDVKDIFVMIFLVIKVVMVSILW